MTPAATHTHTHKIARIPDHSKCVDAAILPGNDYFQEKIIKRQFCVIFEIGWTVRKCSKKPYRVFSSMH